MNHLLLLLFVLLSALEPFDVTGRPLPSSESGPWTACNVPFGLISMQNDCKRLLLCYQSEINGNSKLGQRFHHGKVRTNGIGQFDECAKVMEGKEWHGLIISKGKEGNISFDSSLGIGGFLSTEQINTMATKTEINLTKDSEPFVKEFQNAVPFGVFLEDYGLINLALDKLSSCGKSGTRLCKKKLSCAGETTSSSRGSSPFSQGSTPSSQGSTPFSQGSTPSSQASTPSSQGSTPSSQGSTLSSQGSSPFFQRSMSSLRLLASSAPIINSTQKLSSFVPFTRHKGQQSNMTPIILGWNKFWGMPVYEFGDLKLGFENCSYDCVYTEDKKFESLASVVMFHGGENLGELPKNRNPKQLFAMMSHESPALCHPMLAHLSNNYFNLSITYHGDSTIHIPYQQFSAITAKTQQAEIWSEEEIRHRMSLKNRSALQIVSNCHSAFSGRAELTKRLQTLMELDVFGKCNGRKCDNECYKQQMDSHFFYMAFENSVCPQYVTEKFWNALRALTVPVVLKRAVLNGTGIPDSVFIAADDFDSAEELAEFLKALQNNTDRYMDYFKWTRMYQKHWDSGNKPSALCQLCKIAHQQLQWDEFRNYSMELEKFWSQKNCRKDYVQNELFKKEH